MDFLSMKDQALISYGDSLTGKTVSLFGVHDENK